MANNASGQCPTGTCDGDQCVEAPSQVPCTEDVECDVGNPCTKDFCWIYKSDGGGTCAKVDTPDYTPCQEGEQSPGLDLGVCIEGECDFFSCGVSEDCDDGNPCTQDYLDKDGCVSTSTPGCKSCVTDDDCPAADFESNYDGACHKGLCTYWYDYGHNSYAYRTGFICTEGYADGETQTGGAPFTPSGGSLYIAYANDKIHLKTNSEPPDPEYSGSLSNASVWGQSKKHQRMVFFCFNNNYI
ncbi:MAG: hypothetical protein ABII02_00385 [Candidatus Magasanikbacteria bacterium]